MMEQELFDIELLKNTQVEMQFVGSLYKNTDLYIEYGSFVRIKYDFSDEAVQFFYDCLEKYYKTASQQKSVDEVTFNMFISQDTERLKFYRKYHGWKTISEYQRLCDPDECKNYFDSLKKYSLLREYYNQGYAVQRILKFPRFDTMNANDIYKAIRIKADKINTVINAGEEAVELTCKNTSQLNSYLLRPAKGLNFPWQMYTDYFLGMRKTKVLFEGFLSNEGKTRKLVLLAAYITLIENKDFLLMSNEMDEVDLRSCLITTVINNPVFQQIHGVTLKKCEKEIVMGQYRDTETGEFIVKRDDETDEEYIERLVSSSEEYQQVKKVSDWIDNYSTAQIYFKDLGKDYSTNTIEFELRKAKLTKNIVYYGYDTLKGYNTDDWSQIKQFATRLKEITKELQMSGFAVFQLADEAVHIPIENLTSMQIANAKQIKHVADYLTLGKKIPNAEKHRYKIHYLSSDDEDWGEDHGFPLQADKTYFGIKIDKNRAGAKDKIIVLEINLDYNTWENIGWLELVKGA